MAKASEFAAFAARLPDEGDILAAVAAKTGDAVTRLVYADWLEERGDSRAAFLRAFVAAVESGGKLPAARGQSEPWLQMIGYRLEARIRKLKLLPHRSAVLALARPAVAIRTRLASEAKLRVGTTKFGGRPDLEAGADWPACDEGPLEFLAQFDLAEVRRTIAGRALPPDGLLSFFMYHHYNNDEFGDEPGRGYPGGLQIVHTPAGTVLERLDPPEDMDDEQGAPKTAVCRVVLADALDVPRPTDDAWADEFGPDFPKNLEHELVPKSVWNSDHQLFGYARVTVLGQDPIPGPEWELLLRFDSDDRLGWNWGDGHRLFWYVRTADLPDRRFDRTTAIDG